jgi:hypothetical protein
VLKEQREGTSVNTLLSIYLSLPYRLILSNHFTFARSIIDHKIDWYHFSIPEIVTNPRSKRLDVTLESHK